MAESVTGTTVLVKERVIGATAGAEDTWPTPASVPQDFEVSSALGPTPARAPQDRSEPQGKEAESVYRDDRLKWPSTLVGARHVMGFNTAFACWGVCLDPRDEKIGSSSGSK